MPISAAMNASPRSRKTSSVICHSPSPANVTSKPSGNHQLTPPPLARYVRLSAGRGVPWIQPFPIAVPCAWAFPISPHAVSLHVQYDLGRRPSRHVGKHVDQAFQVFVVDRLIDVRLFPVSDLVQRDEIAALALDVHASEILDT